MKEITLENIDRWKKELDAAGITPLPMTFNLPMGQIGNTGVYRISDSVYCGKLEWEYFNRILMEEGMKTTQPLPPNKGINISPLNKKYHK